MKVRTLPFLFHLVLLLSATTAQASLSSRSDTPGGFHQCVETIVAPGNVVWRNTSANAGFSDSNDHALVSKRQAMRRDSPSRADNAPTHHRRASAGAATNRNADSPPSKHRPPVRYKSDQSSFLNFLRRDSAVHLIYPSDALTYRKAGAGQVSKCVATEAAARTRYS